MTFEEFGKFLNRLLFPSLDRISGARLVRVVYVLGLAVAAVWAIAHFFATFALGFWEGIWGLVEILVFGLFGLTLLRVACEAVIVYFEANQDAVRTASKPAVQSSLIDEVRDAIEQLGEDETEAKPVKELEPAKPAKAGPAKSARAAKSPAAAQKTTPAKRTPRTAKRTPKPKPGTGEG